MPQGLQVWRNNGQLLVNVSSRLSRILGIISAGAGTSGVFTSAGLLTGQPYLISLYLAGTMPNNAVVQMVGPQWSVSGNQLFYHLADPTGDQMMIIGVY